MRMILEEKNIINRRTVRRSDPEPPLASDGWELHPQTTALLLLPAITTSSSSFLAINTFYYKYFFKKEENNYTLFCFCFFCAFASIFGSKSVVLVGRGARIFLPLGAGYPSYATATPQIEGLNVFEEDLYAMSVEENTFQPQLQQLIIGREITFKKKGLDLNSRPLSQNHFLSRAQIIKYNFYLV